MATKSKAAPEEASLDDFFQPPSEEGGGAGESFEVDLSAGAPSGGAAPQVQDLPVEGKAGMTPEKKKKLLLIGGAALGVILLLGIGIFVFGGKKEAPPPPPPAAKKETPPPQLKVARLTDVERSPGQAHELGSKLADAATGKLAEAGQKKLGALQAPLSFYIGAFVVSKNLEAAKEKLRPAGLAFKVAESKALVRMHRLHIGTYDTSSGGAKAREKLKKAGFDAFVIKESKGVYKVYAGSFFTSEKAQEYKTKLLDAKTGFVGTVEDTQAPVTLWELWAGSFSDAAQAQAALEKVLAAGVEVDVTGAK